MKIIPVILCGGSGTRLSSDKPKQFLRLFSNYSMLQETALRALRITGNAPDRLVTVTLEKFEDEAREHLEALDSLAATHILAEPRANGTAAAIILAAGYVGRNFGPNSLMWIFPSDHYIGNEAALGHALRAGIPAAQEGYIVTFGITPTRPDLGYGYIAMGEPLQNGVRHAETFIEKPGLTDARKLVASGCLWNSGMFLGTAETILQECVLHGAQPGKSFDKAVMEKSSRIAVVPCDPQWSDIGSQASLQNMQIQLKKAS